MFDMEESKNVIDQLLGYTLDLGKGVKSTLSMDKQVDIPTLSEEASEKQKKEHKKILDESLISIGGENVNVDPKYLALDGAAMCSYVYANNKLRKKGTVYETHSKEWNAFSDIAILGNGNDKDGISDRKYSEAGMGIGLGILRDRDKNSTQLFNILKERLIRERTGFGSGLFYRMTNKEVHSIAYVLEGSGPLNLQNELKKEKTGFWESPLQDRIGDWVLTNGLQGLTGLSPQHTLAIQNAKIIHQICLLRGIDNLYFFGHSLGGGLAIACALATHRPAIVYDPAGLHILRLIKQSNTYLNMVGSDKIICYYLEGEALSSILWSLLLLKHNGKRVMLINKEANIRDKIGFNFNFHSLDLICKRFGLTSSSIKNFK